MLTIADLHGTGQANPLTTLTDVSPPPNPEQLQALIDAASALAKSPSMAALLVDLAALKTQIAAYRVAVVNATDPVGQAEVQAVNVRQKVLAAQVTEADPILRAKVSNVLPTLDGVTSRLADVYQQLLMIEAGLQAVETMITDVLTWAEATGYPPAPVPG